MSDLMTMLPIYAFMLIPVWIPVIAMTCGAISDALRASRDTARSLAHAHPVSTVSAGRPVPVGGTAQ